MKRFIRDFLGCCFVGALIFLVLIAVSVWAYLGTVVAVGLFGAVYNWARGYD